VIVSPDGLPTFTEADGNYLVVISMKLAAPVRYYAGFAWDQAGQVKNVGEWDGYLEQYAKRIASPVAVRLSAGTTP
jgi:hypothetical protein